ncbi:hypothetical protein GCM10010273_41510 [Streptomyces lavendulocolor]
MFWSLSSGGRPRRRGAGPAGLRSPSPAGRGPGRPARPGAGAGVPAGRTRLITANGGGGRVHPSATGRVRGVRGAQEAVRAAGRTTRGRGAVGGVSGRLIGFRTDTRAFQS